MAAGGTGILLWGVYFYSAPELQPKNSSRFVESFDLKMRPNFATKYKLGQIHTYTLENVLKVEAKSKRHVIQRSS